MHTVKASCTLQSLIALSVGEAEFYALVLGAAILLSLQSLLADLGLSFETQIRADSTTAKAITDRTGVNRTKHIQTRWLWTQERIQAGDISVAHVRSADNFSDVLTKAMSKVLLDKHVKNMGLTFHDGGLASHGKGDLL